MNSVGWKNIASFFRSAIEEERLPDGAPLPSESQLAEEWNVSRMTVHRAMTELQKAGLVERKRRVGTVVISPNRPAAAPSTSSRTSTTIAFLIDDQRDRMAIEYIQGVSTAIPEEYRLLLFNTQGIPEREAECLHQLQGEVDGILLFPINSYENIGIIEETIRQGVPVVSLDRVIDHPDVISVISDNFGDSLTALRYLRGRGHDRIAHFNWGPRDTPEISPVQERYDAWKQIMEESGATAPQRWLRRYPQHVPADLEHLTLFAHDALFSMLHQPDPPTAVFCVNDYFLVALLNACADLGIVVPDQLEILSFNDGIQLMPRQARAVHRIVQRTHAIGREAMEILLARIKEEESPMIVRMAADFYPAEIGVDISTMLPR